MNKKIIAISILSMMYCGFADSAWNRGNTGRANQTNRVSTQLNPTTSTNGTPTTNTATTTSNVVLPIDVKNETLKQRILRNDPTSPVQLGDLQNCANIWNGGVFVWGPANGGTMNVNHSGDTCTAVITLRDSNTNSILATANVGANGHFKCNIDSFPNKSFTEMIQNVTFPADKEPTEEDVREVMNSERKENAGFKALAGAIVGGLAGNLAVKSDTDSAISLGQKGGTQRSKKILATLGGATVMGGAMYATTQMDNTSGTITENALVNATGGAFLGNIYSGATGGDSDYIKTIKIDGVEYALGNYMDKNSQTKTEILYQLFEKNGTKLNKFYKCQKENTYSSNFKCSLFSNLNLTSIERNSENCIGFDENLNFLKTISCNNTPSKYLREMEVATSSNIKIALAKVKDKDEKGRKLTYSAFYDSKDGKTLGNPIAITSSDFMPTYTSAGDGGVIDFSNKGRAKATAIGGVGGGAIGGFAGYQQANQELSDRYTTAVQTYKDSLKKFYCVSGGNVLGFYNEQIVIPAYN